MQTHQSLIVTVVLLLLVAVAAPAQTRHPTDSSLPLTDTPVIVSPTPMPTITHAGAGEIRPPASPPESFWDKYGVVTALVSAIIALLFGVLVRPAMENLAQLVVAKLKSWRSDFQSRYLRKLIEEHRVLKIRGVVTKGPGRPELEQVYVYLRARTRGADLSRDGGLDIRAAMRQHQRLAIIGEAGSGKTTLLAYLALTFARHQQRDRLAFEGELLPIIVPLRRLTVVLSESEAAPVGLASYLTNYYQGLEMNPPEDFFEEHLREGSCLVLLDGLDEVAEEAERVRMAEWVDEQVAVYPDNRYMLTSRVVGYEKAELTNDFTVLEIQPFRDEDIKQFCYNWCLGMELALQGEDNETVRREAEKDANDLIAAVGKNPAIRKLAVNPLMLSIIALVHHYRATLPQRRVELYGECMDVLLGFWDKAKGLPSYLTERQKRAVLQPIALAMHKAKQRLIDYDSLKTWLEAQLPKVGGEARGAERFLQDIKERSGVLLESETNEYAFSHLSFQEYLTAVELLKTGKEEELLRHTKDTWWHEVIRLYAGMKDATSLVEALLASGSASQLLLAGSCLIDAEKVDKSTRDRTVRRLEALFASCQDELFLRVGQVLAEIGGEDSVDFFLNIAVEDDKRARAAIHALVQMVEQPDEDVRRRVQGRLVATVRAGSPDDAGKAKSHVLLQRRALEVLHRTDDPSIVEFLRQERCPEEMVTIPVGSFTMGEGNEACQITLPTFFIEKYPVTNAVFAHFIKDGGYIIQDYWTEIGREEKERGAWTQPHYWEDEELNNPTQPVVGVSWYEAVAYCNWRAAKTGLPYRLPTEAEWEKAARGTDGRRYPWDDEWDDSKCNTRESGPGTTTQVGAYSPSGDSPYGVADMAGNVWEWCSSLYKKYPYDPHDGREHPESRRRRTVRGGSWNFHRKASRSVFRDGDYPTIRLDDVGFRCCMSF